MFPEIDSKTLKKWMKNRDVLLVDVREPSEFESERIEGALLIPLSLVSYECLPLEGKTKIVFQCRSGKRSQLACSKVQDDIDDKFELYSLAGGILAWREAGFSVLSGPEKEKLLDKICSIKNLKSLFASTAHQACFIGGALLLFCIFLSAFASPHFAWGFLLVAIGLIVSAFKKS
ncbi:MAG: rhodanese-like domain-containing protein [Candidatus Paracaedibacteraceae bacterium]|nr:rhodanese-like domain-containing protein [Candidatus Paracaedibacteraceae bacterium]